MKWKNYGLWVSIASVMYMILKDLGLQIDLTQWETYVTSILGILVTLGIISNPESGKGFFDAKTKSTENVSLTNSTNKVNQSANVIENSGSVVENNNNQMHQSESTDSQEIPFDEELMPDRKYAPYEK
ncbi:hypothetical protein [Metabacillus litoralis]|uniref:hypothetical protein n=1 Tax=Metabacillus litoralis TaxID=152268 RepID=UPI001877A12E|nr:hypothetical protein [Metabacillus litoralis]